MERAEAMKIVGYLEACFARDIGDPSRLAYAEELSPYEFEPAFRAIRRYVQTSGDDWFPSAPALIGVVRAATPRPLGALRDPGLAAELESGSFLTPSELADRARELRARLPVTEIRSPLDQARTPSEGDFHACGGTWVVNRRGSRECGWCGTPYRQEAV